VPRMPTHCDPTPQQQLDAHTGDVCAICNAWFVPGGEPGEATAARALAHLLTHRAEQIARALLASEARRLLLVGALADLPHTIRRYDSHVVRVWNDSLPPADRPNSLDAAG
jgi:hypothetical protein